MKFLPFVALAIAGAASTLLAAQPAPIAVTVEGLAPGPFRPDRASVWRFHRDNPALRNGGAVDVEHIRRWHMLVQESREGTRWAVGTSETALADRGFLFRKSGRAYDRFGHVSPNLYVNGDRLVAVYFGAATGKPGIPAAAWNRNRIGVAFLQKGIRILSEDGKPVDAQILALDSDRAEARLPASLKGRKLIFEILAEDGRAALAGSTVVAARVTLRLLFGGGRTVD